MELSQYHRADFKQFVQDHLNEDPALLLFKYQGKTDFDLKAAVQQIAARQKAKKKLPSWTSNPDLIFPASVSLEQSSSEETAKFKSNGQSGQLLIDLTGGFGVDSFHLSKGFEKAIYCEQQEELAKIAFHNLETLTPDKFQLVIGDGLDFLAKSEKHFDLIYGDPARRGDSNQKLYKLADCQPNVVATWELMKSKANSILLKLSPMLDISQALEELPEIQKVKIVSVKNEVKELLLIWNKNGIENPPEIEAIDLGRDKSSFSFSSNEEVNAQASFGEAGKYLIEPYSAILKAGAFKTFGIRFGLKKLDANTHLYTSNEVNPDIPGRIFEILEEINPKKNELKKRFPSGKVNVITRNYASGSDAFKKKFGLKDGGDDFLIGTKTASGFKVFWCRLV
ncbi:MAG: class I SAM-dependent methyltransferase [Algoriphagus sp.]|uniref:class I SAM-dependent methyltransferase n=1 Tax=Algoriphagus sp. TaxID=1872435 RepID=UPI0026361522|nr:class I SAM-dependent methyltransferase [Algoriphagus sp.]MDG1279602.1 class I SAM-dependent methyltransferase [Algoriphagus sp.]